MKGNLPGLFYVLLTLTCVSPGVALLLVTTHREFEQALTWVLSTELVAPSLIVGLACLVYLVHKAESASH